MKMEKAKDLKPSGIYLAGDATIVPVELLKARSAYHHACDRLTNRLMPEEMHQALQALFRAEQSFRLSPESKITKQLAYIAQQMSEMAEALAVMSAYRVLRENINNDSRNKHWEQNMHE